MSPSQQLTETIAKKFDLNVTVSPDNKTTTISMNSTGVALLLGSITHVSVRAGIVERAPQAAANPIAALAEALAPALLGSFVATVCEAQLAARGKSVTYDEKGTMVVAPVTLQ